MKSFENIHEQENAIIEGREEPKNRGQVQMLLATQLYEYMFGKPESHEDIMDYWVGDSHINDGFAAKFAQLEKDPIFLQHPRLKGEIKNITVEDIIQYTQEESLPQRSFDREQRESHNIHRN